MGNCTSAYERRSFLRQSEEITKIPFESVYGSYELNKIETSSNVKHL